MLHWAKVNYDCESIKRFNLQIHEFETSIWRIGSGAKCTCSPLLSQIAFTSIEFPSSILRVTDRVRRDSREGRGADWRAKRGWREPRCLSAPSKLWTGGPQRNKVQPVPKLHRAISRFTWFILVLLNLYLIYLSFARPRHSSKPPCGRRSERGDFLTSIAQIQPLLTDATPYSPPSALSPPFDVH